MSASYAMSYKEKPHCPLWSDKGVRKGATEDSVKLRKESLMAVEMEDSSLTINKKLCYLHEFKTLARK